MYNLISTTEDSPNGLHRGKTRERHGNRLSIASLSQCKKQVSGCGREYEYPDVAECVVTSYLLQGRVGMSPRSSTSGRLVDSWPGIRKTCALQALSSCNVGGNLSNHTMGWADCQQENIA